MKRRKRTRLDTLDAFAVKSFLEDKRKGKIAPGMRFIEWCSINGAAPSMAAITAARARDAYMDAAIRAAKKRNPTDATLRNIRALKARVSKLEQAVKRLEKRK
ncbi:MAG TPA: hypothetical protein VHL34_24785 [Rhizomicrobium sp.]|jgi:hypothetical protein|nr:hypothetical protein [Rhizomicrobium sp.]